MVLHKSAPSRRPLAPYRLYRPRMTRKTFPKGGESLAVTLTVACLKDSRRPSVTAQCLAKPLHPTAHSLRCDYSEVPLAPRATDPESTYPLTHQIKRKR
jgi:hypothetical protein